MSLFCLEKLETELIIFCVYKLNRCLQPEAWERTELSSPQPGGLRRSWRSLRFRIPANASGNIRVRCEAILMVEPAVVRDTSTTITVFSRTEISKFVSNNRGKFYYCSLLRLCLPITIYGFRGKR